MEIEAIHAQPTDREGESLKIVTAIEVKFDKVYTLKWTREVQSSDEEYQAQRDYYLQGMHQFRPLGEGELEVAVDDLERDVPYRTLNNSNKVPTQTYKKNLILEEIRGLVSGHYCQSLIATLGERILLKYPQAGSTRVSSYNLELLRGPIQKLRR